MNPLWGKASWAAGIGKTSSRLEDEKFVFQRNLPPSRFLGHLGVRRLPSPPRVVSDCEVNTTHTVLLTVSSD
jgi:hypothetical protein